MNHVMIDLETLSTRSDAAIVSIAAVKFEPRTGKTGERFYTHPDLNDVIEKGFHVDGSTIAWWMEQSDEARGEAFKNYVNPLSVVLSEFWTFIGYDSFVWGNPVSFDLPIIENARLKLGFTAPFWNRRNIMCLRTLKNLVPDSVYKTEFEGVPHHPLDDCLHQIKQAHKICSHLGL